MGGTTSGIILDVTEVHWFDINDISNMSVVIGDLVYRYHPDIKIEANRTMNHLDRVQKL